MRTSSTETTSEIPNSIEIPQEIRNSSMENNSLFSDDVKGENVDNQLFLNRSSAMPLLDYNRPESVRQFFESPILNGGQELLQDLWRDNIYFREKLEDSKNECLELKRKERCHQANGVQDLIKENNFLKQRNRTQMEFGPFRHTQFNTHSSQTLEKIHSRFKMIKHHCGVISRSPENKFQFPKFLPSNGSSEDATQLIRAAVGNDKATISQLENRISAEQMVHCLIGVSIQEWVLKPPLLCTAMLSTPLLDHYKDHIQALGK